MTKLWRSPDGAEGAADADPDERQASRHAEHLLAGLGLGFQSADAPDHPAVSWVRSGMAEVTGRRDGPPLMAPVGLSAIADGALLALAALAPGSAFGGLRGAALLGQRGRLAGLTRQGAISPGGGCRLLGTADGVMAVSLVRPTDWDFAPAWLEDEVGGWDDVRRILGAWTTAQALERGRLLGLAVADAVGEPDAGASPVWHRTVARGAALTTGRRSAPLVVDLSALWAGPLCADLLGRMGARVIKVESRSRPDGARAGSEDFYAALNGGKASVVLDFGDGQDRAALAALIEAADIVIESARPRGLGQLGIHAEAIVARRPGLTWIAISGHGRGEPEAGWIGYGDDAGVAAGLSRCMHGVHGEWLFCGDAIADPLTGLHAALLAWASWQRGGGVLEAISLSGVAASALAADGDLTMPVRRERTRRWAALAQAEAGPLYDLPRPRGATEAAGASTRAILSECAPC
ncbi:MAG: hypothetical protein JWP35_1245 [Caulobacter sp.]|nr:hypothetical protein [Caulobacter sp.]